MTNNANDLSVSPLFSTGAILQRDKSVVIWGTGKSNSQIKVDLAGEIKITQVNQTGQWSAAFKSHDAGEKARLIVSDGATTIISDDLIFGDVWLLGGQSNMQLWMSRVKTRYFDEMNQITYPEIRSFTVPQVVDFTAPRQSISGGQWEYAIQEQIDNFSAIGYFMAKRLHQELNVPIGLIATAIGGTPIEAWLPQTELAAMGLLSKEHDLLQEDDYIQKIIDQETARDQLYDQNMQAADVGLFHHYEQPHLDDSDWQQVGLADPWPKLFQQPGVIWLRKQVKVPKEYTGLPGQLRLGTLADADEIYLDGQKIGETGYKYPPREYDMPILKDEMTLAIRIQVFYGNGGFTRGKPHYIHTPMGQIDLDQLGPWKIKQTVISPMKQAQTFFQYKQVGLYNGMIAPLRQFGIKGVAFYQGESNTARPENYSVKLQRLIQAWRKQFNQGTLPFIFVQLANLSLEPQNDYARLREEQRSALALDNTGMVTTIDLGEYNDLHPTNKKDVGQRIANLALALAYDEPITATGPLPIDAIVNGDQIIIRFQNAEGLRADHITMELLTDHNNYQLTGTVSHQTVILDLPKQVIPVRGWRLRYAFSNNPTATLYNANDLPATPFELLVSIL